MQINKEVDIMANKNTSGKGLYFVLGALVVGVLGMGFMMYSGQSADKPDLSIEITDKGLEVDSN